MRRRQIIAELLTKNHQHIRNVLPAKSVTTLRWNKTSTSYLTLRDAHSAVADVVNTDGARCAIWYVEIDGVRLSKQKLMEGRVGTIAGNDAPFGTVSIPVFDDFANLDTILGWQVPSAPITGQSAAEYARYTGTSEDNAKAAIAANVARLGLPWDVADSLHRGDPDTAPIELRMHELSEKLLAALTVDRLQLTIIRDGTRYDVDVSEGDVYTRPLTPQSGVVASWSWVQEPPTATRAVVGGRGEGVEREFTLVIDADLEAQLGVVMEIFVDARNAPEGADLAPYGWAELAKRRGRSGLTAELRETSWFQFPAAFNVGTRLSLQLGALPVDDVITQVQITHDDKGFRAVPTVGLATEDPQERLVGYVKNVASAVRGLERR